MLLKPLISIKEKILMAWKVFRISKDYSFIERLDEYCRINAHSYLKKEIQRSHISEELFRELLVVAIVHQSLDIIKLIREYSKWVIISEENYERFWNAIYQ
jgi:hypothetical protein